MSFIKKKSLILLTNEGIHQKIFGARSEGLNPILAIVHLTLLALFWMAAPATAKKASMAPKHDKKGTNWSPNSGIKPGSKMYLIETYANPKKGKWNNKNELDTDDAFLSVQELEEKKWDTTSEPKDTWTPPTTATWLPKETTWDSLEVTAEPEDLMWTETTWDPMNAGGTWDHNHNKWSGAEPEPEGKWRDDGKWTEPQSGLEALKWTETTPGPEGKWTDEPVKTNTWTKVFGKGIWPDNGCINFLKKIIFFKIPDLTHRPTSAPIVTENRR